MIIQGELGCLVVQQSAARQTKADSNPQPITFLLKSCGVLTVSTVTVSSTATTDQNG